MLNKIRSLAGLAAAVWMAGASQALAANIVFNPSFESGLSGWTSQFWGINTTNSVFPGAQSAFTGCQPVTCITDPSAFLFQDVSTVVGNTYVFSFYFGDFGPADGSPMQLQALAGGALVADLAGNTPDAFFRFSPAITFAASSSTTRIQFNGRDLNRFLYLDQVCVDVNGGACGFVQDGAFIPEPSTWLLAGTGLIVLWRRRQPLA